MQHMQFFGPVGSMGIFYFSHTWMVDFYGKCTQIICEDFQSSILSMEIPGTRPHVGPPATLILLQWGYGRMVWVLATIWGFVEKFPKWMNSTGAFRAKHLNVPLLLGGPHPIQISHSPLLFCGKYWQLYFCIPKYLRLNKLLPFQLTNNVNHPRVSKASNRHGTWCLTMNSIGGWLSSKGTKIVQSLPKRFQVESKALIISRK